MIEFTEEQLKKIVKTGVDRYMLVYDHVRDGTLSLRLLALIDDTLRVNSDNKNKLTTLIVSNICIAELKQYLIDNKFNLMLQASLINDGNISMCGFNIVSSYLYRDYLDFFFKDCSADLYRKEDSLVIGLDLSDNPDLDNIEKERIILASY